MGREGATVRESHDAPGFSAAELRRRIDEVLAEDPHYHVASLGTDRFRLARSYRPTWALVLTVLTAPIVGLGLLFLLVKRTESCDVVIVDGPTSAVVTITGRLLPTTLTAVKEAADHRSVDHINEYVPDRPRSPSPSTERVARTDPVPVGPAPSLPLDSSPRPRPGPDRHRAPAPLRKPPTPQPAMTHATPAPAAPMDMNLPEDATRARPARTRPATITLRLNGSVVGAITPHRPVYVGREPLGDGDCVPVGDDALGVSKTHLCVWTENSEICIRDLHSTNGTTIVGPNGQVRSALPGESAILQSGDIVHFGGQTLEVHRT